jgi:hypothetical protein
VFGKHQIRILFDDLFEPVEVILCFPLVSTGSYALVGSTELVRPVTLILTTVSVFPYQELRGSLGGVGGVMSTSVGRQISQVNTYVVKK